MLLRFRGRFPWWGELRLLGTKVPWSVSPEMRGGPWAPPPRGVLLKAVLFLSYPAVFWVASLSVVARNAVFFFFFFRSGFLCCRFGCSFRGSVKVLSVLGLFIMTSFGGPNWVTQTSWFGFSTVCYNRTKCCPFYGLAFSSWNAPR